MSSRLFGVSLAALVATCNASALAQYAYGYVSRVSVASRIEISDPAGLRQGYRNYQCLGFVNQASKTATMIRFVYTYIDAQGEIVGSNTFVQQGTFEPGVIVKRPVVELPRPGYVQDFTKYPNCQPYDFPKQGIATCVISVDRVDYADGTSWTNPEPFGAARATASPSATASPR